MLTKVKTLTGYKLHSRDGEIGKVKEFLFDDQHWAIRYLVADTGSWLMDRQVLISPYALTAVNTEEQHITVDLTKKQIENSPPLGSDKPVSQQFETDYYGFYGWPTYWAGPYMWGYYPQIVRGHLKGKTSASARDEKAWDRHLRSTRAVSSYGIQATDGELGHVDDFIIDDQNWAIRYLVIDTKNWWPGKKVLVSPHWIESVNWDQSKVFVNLLREAIKQSPEYSEESLLTRDYETVLHRHYNRHGYWVDDPATKAKKHSR
jgi:hypothetical protein